MQQNPQSPSSVSAYSVPLNFKNIILNHGIKAPSSTGKIHPLDRLHLFLDADQPGLKKYPDLKKLPLDQQQDHQKYRALMQDLIAHEREFLGWLAADPSHVEAFEIDPIAAFQKACGPSADLMKRLKAHTQDIAKQAAIDPKTMVREVNQTLDHFAKIAPSMSSQAKTVNPPNFWNIALEGGGSNPVSLIATEKYLYTGCNGYVQLFDAVTGKQLASNPLQGQGKYDVGMALSQDSSTLFVATDGYVTALDSGNLTATAWNGASTSLDHISDEQITLLVSGDTLYAAGNGYVYQLDAQTGAITNSNGLDDRGNHNISLALSSDQSTLFVGTDGYTIGLDPQTLATLWQYSMSHTGDNDVSLLVYDGGVYAGSNGYIYQVTNEGQSSYSSSLPKRGHHNISLCFGPCVETNSPVIFAGTGGYVVVLNAQLTTITQISLPNTGSNDVSVLFANNTLYAASDGYLFMLNPQSFYFNYSMQLEFGGNNDVNIVISPDGANLYCGVGSNAGCVPSCGDFSAGWDIVAAFETEAVNDLLNRLHGAGKLPQQVNGSTTIGDKTLALSSSLGVPQISGDYGALTLEMPLNGTLKLSENQQTKTLTIGGSASVTLDLRAISLTITQPSSSAAEKWTKTTYTLALEFNDKPFTAINLKNMTFDPKIKPFLIPIIQKFILSALNETLTHLKQPISTNFNLPFSLPLENLITGLTYVGKGKDPGFLAVMLGSTEGNYNLLPSTIHAPKDSSTGLVLSNRFLTETVNKVMNLIMPCQVSNGFPAVVSNSQTQPLPKTYGISSHIDSGGLNAQFNGNQFEFNITVMFWGFITGRIHQPAKVNLSASFHLEDGVIVMDFSTNVHIPWYVYMTVGFMMLPFLAIIAIIPGLLAILSMWLYQLFPDGIEPYLDNLLKELFADYDGLPIPIPFFNVNDLDVFNFIRLCGHFEESIFPPLPDPNN